MSEPAAASSIAEDSVLTARGDVDCVEVDGEFVLYDDVLGVLHRLNPTASALWQCLDGSGTLEEIAADMADIYAADPAQVLADVVGTARRFDEAGLLVDAGAGRGREGGATGPVALTTDRPWVMTEPEHDISPSDPAPDDVAAQAASRAAAEGGIESRFVSEAPTPCMDPSFTLGPDGVLTVRAGKHLLGLRLSTPELVVAARGVLGDGLVPGVVPPPNVSVVETQTRMGRPLYFCYRSGRLVSRVTSTRRALQAAATLLSSYDDDAAAENRVRIWALAAVRDGEAVLLCHQSQLVAEGLRPRLRAMGWELADTTNVDLDPTTGDVVIAPPSVPVNREALAQLESPGRDHPPPAPGTYPVRAWVVVPARDPAAGTAAARVADVAAGADGLSTGSARVVLEAIRRMLDRAVWAVSPALDAAAIARTVAEAVPDRA